MPALPGRAVCHTVYLLALPWVLLCSCLHPSRRPSATPVPAETQVGVVRAVGANQRFVLVETPSALAASSLYEGELLHCRPPRAPGQAATADLRVARERHESLVIANVVAGEPAAGAIVFASPTGATPTPSRSPDSISEVPTAGLPGLFGSPTP